MSLHNRISACAATFRTVFSHPVRPSYTARPIHSTRHYSITKPWKGDPPEEHTKERAKRGDTSDIAAAADASGMKERERNEGVADETMSQATTERGGLKQGRKAKKEHPAAPEPIIGMNDERAQV